MVLLLLALPLFAQEVPLSPSEGSWHFYDGREFPGAKGELVTEKEVLHLKCDFTGGGRYVAAFRKLDEPLHLEAVTFRAKKPEASQLSFRMTDGAGQTFQKPMLWNHSGWQPVRVGMGNWSGHWGGAGDGVVRQPIVSFTLMIESQNLDPATGEVLFSDVKGITFDPKERKGPAGPREVEYVVTDFGAGSGFWSWGEGVLERGVWSVDLSRHGGAHLLNSVSLLGAPKELKLRVRRAPRGATLNIRLGSHFQSFQREIGRLEGGEQVFDVPMPPEGWKYWGGENDGKVRPPLRLSALGLQKGEAASVPARVELGDLTCVTEVPPGEPVKLLARLRESKPGSRTRLMEAVCEGRALSDREVKGKLALTVRDWEGEVLHTESESWTLPKSGAPAEKSFSFRLSASLNFAEASFSFEADDVRAGPRTAAWAALPEDKGDAKMRPELPWGMGLYFYRYPNNPEGLKMMDQAGALAQAAGVKWSREEFSWARTEPQKGKFDFDFYDKMVETARRHGIQIYGLLSYWSGWTKPNTQEGIDDYARWAREVVRRYKGVVRHWEVWNEPNIFFWTGPKEMYFDLLKKTYAAIKAEDPKAQVLGLSTSGIDLPFIRQGLEAKAPFDALTVHPYRQGLSEAGFLRELREVSKLVDGRPVWITEMGWPTHADGPTDERMQACLLARTYLAAGASGVCPSVSWYDFRCDGDDPYYFEYNFGVMRRDLTPKPAYRALASVCRGLDRPPIRPREDLGEGVLAVESKDALMVWSMGRSMTLPLNVKGSPKVFNLMGEELKGLRKSGRLMLPLRAGRPVAVRGGSVESADAPEPMEAPPAAEALRF